jgi:hypothetical protein
MVTVEGKHLLSPHAHIILLQFGGAVQLIVVDYHFISPEIRAKFSSKSTNARKRSFVVNEKIGVIGT